LGDEELQVFRAERLSPGNPEDGHARTRFPCAVETICHSVPPARPARWPATICNVSAGGLALVSPQPFEEGAILNVEVPAGGGQLRRTVLIRVVSALQRDSGDWAAGGEFAREPGAEVLAAFTLNSRPAADRYRRGGVLGPVPRATR
jgi:hypothetical protein